MSDPVKLFNYANFRRYLRIWWFIGKWLMRLLSASVEICFRSNFGRSYVRMLIGAFLLYLFCFGLNAGRPFLSGLFVVVLIVLLSSHVAHVFRRRWNSIAEPHSSSAGDSWVWWQRFGYAKQTVQRYLEPAVCLVVGLIISLLDPFLGRWLMASAFSLFIKEQISRAKFNRRITAAMDAKIEAQLLNGSVNQFKQKPGQCAQKFHRAHFPHTRKHRQP